jgi:uncharacterized integral membrane protein
MAEKLNKDEVRCSHCKKVVSLMKEYCPNCGTKTDVTGLLVQKMMTFLVMGIVFLVGGLIYRAQVVSAVASSFLLDLYTTGLIVICVIAIIIGALFGVFIVVNKKMRKKLFAEMGVPEWVTQKGR